MKRLLLLALTLTVALWLAGCGSGKKKEDSDTLISGELRSGDRYVTDGNYVDFYEVRARRSGRASVEMTSSNLDSFLIVMSEDASQILATNDDNGSGRDARVEFSVVSDRRYVVAATTYASRDLGQYELTFSRELTDIESRAASRAAAAAAAVPLANALRAEKPSSRLRF